MACFAGCLSFLGAAPHGCRDPALASVAVALLKEYTFGDVLGAGTFGTVYAGTERSTGEGIALKVLDRAKIRTDVIEAEASFLRGLKHPNIVGFRALHFAARHACLVMDQYRSDLVLGLQRHLQKEEAGPLPCGELVHIGRQMAVAVQYLHSVSVVHRDLKADNFLMDREDIRDPACRIALGDFGAACMMRRGERLKSPVGTRMFWAPELYELDYGFKVDVWAMGVTMYSLMTCHFPFRDEIAVREEEPILPKRLPPICRDYLQAMLRKDEELRASADEVTQHAWVSKETQREDRVEVLPGRMVVQHGGKAVHSPGKLDVRGCPSKDACSSTSTEQGPDGSSHSGSASSTSVREDHRGSETSGSGGSCASGCTEACTAGRHSWPANRFGQDAGDWEVLAITAGHAM